MWSSGDVIAIRNIWFDRVRSAAPAVVVEETAERIVAWIPRGSRFRGPVPRGVPTTWTLREGTWQESGPVVHYFGEQWQARHVRPEHAPAWWYVDVLDSVRRTPTTLDHRDLLLDVVVDGAPRVIDEDELTEAVQLGILSGDDADGVERVAEAVLARVARGASPFDGEWDEWQPPADWPLPELPDGWDRV